MNPKPFLPLRIVPDGDQWAVIDDLCTVRFQSGSREVLEDMLPDLPEVLQTAAAIRQQLANVGMIHRGDAVWIV